MTTIDFTERIAQFFTRYMEINKSDYVEKVKNFLDKTPDELEDIVNRDDDELHLDLQGFKGFSLKVKVEWEREECTGEECEYDECEHPLVPLSANLFGKMWYGEIYLGKRNINLTTVEKDWFYSLVKTYTLCVCEENLVEKDGWCKRCYPYVLKHAEECCVCRESEGVWVELKCKHIIHYYCWKKTVGLKCPLCRHTHDHKHQFERM